MSECGSFVLKIFLNYPALRLLLALKLFEEGAFHFDYLGIVLQHDLVGRFLVTSDASFVIDR